MAIYLRDRELNELIGRSGNKVRGKVNRSNGLTFEKRIELSCEYYLNKHIAAIEKTPEPMKIIGTEGNGHAVFRAVFEKKGQPDFKGVLYNGQCVLFEAKHTTMRYISKKVVLDVQTEKFNQYESMGALCFVVVSFNFKNYYRIPWSIWKNMENIFGKSYLTESDIQKYKLPSNENFIDFLFGYTDELTEKNIEEY